MNNKRMIWIDDREDDMKKIISGTFPELWKEGINSQIIFFGDSYPRSANFTSKYFSRFLVDSFFDFYDACTEKEGMLRDSNKNPVKKMYDSFSSKKFNSNQLVKCIPDDIDNSNEIISLMDAWKNLGNDEANTKEFLRVWDDEKSQLPEEYKTDLIFKLISPPQQCAFALDVVLLKGDEEKLNCKTEESIPIISMELYHYITVVLGCECLLYSRYTYSNRLQKNWSYLYKKRYNSSNQESIDIRSRDGLHHGVQNNETINAIKSKFKK